jgi:uncharacterized protein (UPF0276 family)
MLTLGSMEDVPQATPRVAIGAAYEGGDPALLEHMLPFVDYLEVTPETLAQANGSDISIPKDILAELRNLRGSVQIIVHGVGLSIGSHDGWSPTYFQLLDQLLEHVDVAWHSEHLGYTRVDGEHLGIMLALPKTAEALDLVCERVCQIQKRYPMPFLLENIVHVIPDAPADYADAAFLNAVTERTGCEILLDVYNLECDAHNYGFDIPGFLENLRLESVRELHVACGVEHNGFLLDVHSRLTRETTLGLARDVISRAHGHSQLLVYEFMPEAVPGLGYAAIADELRKLRDLFGASV